MYSYLKNNPTDQKLHFFGPGPMDYTALIFPLKSPLAPIFKQGEFFVRERRMERQLRQKWTPKWRESNIDMEKTVLTGGQTFVIFIILAGTFGVTLLILCGEIMHKKKYGVRGIKAKQQNEFPK